MAVLKFANRLGFPCIETTDVTLTTTEETFTFQNHPYLKIRFQGGFFIKVTGTNTAPTTAVPIKFNTQGVANSAVSVYDAQGTELTTATWPGDGIYLMWFDYSDSKVRLIS